MRAPGLAARAAILLTGLAAAPCTACLLGGQIRLPLSPEENPATTAARSLVLPGWGQWHLGQRRSWAYLAVEAGLWVTRLELRASGNHYRDRYQDAAWGSGRIQDGERTEGSWAYYEAMTEWRRSGAFDADPATPGVQPEEDPSTFNGAKWALARGIYSESGAPPGESDPAYDRALAYYEEHAYGSAFLWDWTGKDAALANYRHLIDRSDQRFRQASAALGAVLANHVLSAVDAYISARGGPSTGLRVTSQPRPTGTRWTVSARLVVRP